MALSTFSVSSLVWSFPCKAIHQEDTDMGEKLLEWHDSKDGCIYLSEWWINRNQMIRNVVSHLCNFGLKKTKQRRNERNRNIVGITA